MVSFIEAKKLFNEEKYAEALLAYSKLSEIFGDSAVRYEMKKCKEFLHQSEKNIFNKERISNCEENHVHISSLIKQVNDFYVLNRETFLCNKYPLVSVIMTSYNMESYIESAVTSLLNQSYENLEIIIVDDNSCDKTIAILERLNKSNSKIKFLRLNSNLGTYYAKNVGILHSKGSIIFFHDTDDVCHKYRIELSVNELLKYPDAIAVRSAYARVNPDTGNIVRVDKHIYKLGLITLGLRREVFNRIGFFNCTTKASDDEFFNRMKRYFKKDKIIDLYQPLYFNTMRSGSLISDMVDWKGEGQIEQKSSSSRADYVSKFNELHRNSKVRFADLFIFPNIRDIITVNQDMSKLSNPNIDVYISVCSIPQRQGKLKKVVNVLINQCDYLHVYLDGYNEVPKFLLDNPKIFITKFNNKEESLRDNAKFLLLEKLVRDNIDAYYLTVDDDINYPLDYVNSMIKKLNYYNDKVILGVHGVSFFDFEGKYFCHTRQVFAFYRALEEDKIVNILGTGTVAFRTNCFSQFSLSDFKFTGMADLFFAMVCQNAKLLQIVVSRYENWLDEMPKDTPSLFDEFKENDSKQSKLVGDNELFGFRKISHILEHTDNDLKVKLPKLPKLGFLLKNK